MFSFDRLRYLSLIAGVVLARTEAERLECDPPLDALDTLVRSETAKTWRSIETDLVNRYSYCHDATLFQFPHPRGYATMLHDERVAYGTTLRERAYAQSLHGVYIYYAQQITKYVAEQRAQSQEHHAVDALTASTRANTYRRMIALYDEMMTHFQQEEPANALASDAPDT